MGPNCKKRGKTTECKIGHATYLGLDTDKIAPDTSLVLALLNNSSNPRIYRTKQINC
jgi:hypothetical protein